MVLGRGWGGGLSWTLLTATDRLQIPAHNCTGRTDVANTEQHLQQQLFKSNCEGAKASRPLNSARFCSFTAQVNTFTVEAVSVSVC